MRKRSIVALVCWALTLPAATVWMLGELEKPMNNGYLMPFIAIGIAIAILVGAVVFGALTRTIGASLLGTLLGVPLAFGTGSALIEKASRDREALIAAENAELKIMIAALRSQDKAALGAALARRKLVTVPRFMCVIAADAGNSEADAFGDEKPFVISAATLIAAAESVAGMNLPQDEKEASLAQAFKGIANREALDQLPAWIGLWDKAKGGKNGREIAFSTRYSEDRRGCDWGSTSAIAKQLTETWGDKGILAWLATGHTFVEGQRQVVLHGLKEPATLEAVVARGVRYGPPYAPVNGPDEEPRFASFADKLKHDLRYGEKPEQAVDLLAAYRKFVPSSKEGQAEMALECAEFQAERADMSPKSLQGREKQVAAFEKLLCSTN